jgi:hypothetical protein
MSKFTEGWVATAVRIRIKSSAENLKIGDASKTVAFEYLGKYLKGLGHVTIFREA